MKNDNFDREIASLYQQRKQQIEAPEINFAESKATKKTRYSVLQMLSILFFGGAASFGILAVISHFSVKPPIEPMFTSVGKLNIVELEKEEVISRDDVVIVQAPLIPIKPHVAPVQPQHEKALEIKKVDNDLAISLPTGVVNVGAYPTLKQPELSLVPIYQEQPKYSDKAIRARQSGTVKLAYNISSQGKVTDITIVESNVNRQLNNSAKRALSKWLYKPNEFNEEGYEIIFDFILNEKK